VIERTARRRPAGRGRALDHRLASEAGLYRHLSDQLIRIRALRGFTDEVPTVADLWCATRERIAAMP
jgi:hypothetical protein